jgi:hypothetical protein
LIVIFRLILKRKLRTIVRTKSIQLARKMLYDLTRQSNSCAESTTCLVLKK